MKVANKFLFFCMIIVAKDTFAQYIKADIKSKVKTGELLPAAFLINHAFKISEVLPQNFSTIHLGFFCKQELKFESATNVLLKFRVGEVEYCDWMEGKKRTSILPIH